MSDKNKGWTIPKQIILGYKKEELSFLNKYLRRIVVCVKNTKDHKILWQTGDSTRFFYALKSQKVNDGWDSTRVSYSILPNLKRD